MAVSAQFNAFVLDLLGAVRPVTARRMFGGVGYYADGSFFAIAEDDVLYFRVDETSRSEYEAAGLQAFAPLGPGTKSMNYYTLPARLYDDAEELAVWLRRALCAARAGGDQRRKRRA
jgi:DNA transformation protein and related proteins